MSEARETVTALVLTHNAPDALVECIRRVRRELEPGDCLLVVDNASREPASAVLATARLLGGDVEVLALDENVGPAGGYARGLQRFLEGDGRLAWIVDDDMLPEPGALAVLRRAVLRENCEVVAFPRVTDPQGAEWHHPAWCGVLIPRGVVEKVGVPREEFFWWIEDTEYLQWRIPRAGFRTVRILEASVCHQAVRRTKMKPAWKYYYETRNTLYFRVYVQLRGGVPAWRMARRVLRTTLRSMARIAIVEDDKLAKFAAVARGVRDGFTARLAVRYPGPDGARPPD